MVGIARSATCPNITSSVCGDYFVASDWTGASSNTSHKYQTCLTSMILLGQRGVLQQSVRKCRPRVEASATWSSFIFHFHWLCDRSRSHVCGISCVIITNNGKYVFWTDPLVCEDYTVKKSVEIALLSVVSHVLKIDSISVQCVASITRWLAVRKAPKLRDILLAGWASVLDWKNTLN